MAIDNELAQLRAVGAMDALEFLFDATAPGVLVPAEHVASLLALARDAVSAALPGMDDPVGSNDDD